MVFLVSARQVLSYTPYLFSIGFYSFVIRATITLGYVPYYNHPDPGLLRFDRHKELVEMSFNIALFGTAVWLLLGIVSIFFKALRLRRRYNVAFFIGIALIIFILALDPLGEWYWD